MESKKAFDLTRLMNVYNILQVFANLYVFLRVCSSQELRCTCNTLVTSTDLLRGADATELSLLLHSRA